MSISIVNQDIVQKVTGSLLGKFIGEVPMIKEEIFNMLKTGMDPYEPHKKMSDAFVVVLEPTHWEVLYDSVLFDDLLNNGDFEVTGEEKEKGMLVPHSLKNVKILGAHAAKELGIKDVFNDAYLPSEKVQEILNQCSTVAKTVKVTIMRVDAPPQTFGKSNGEQKDLLQLNGHENVSLCTRYYYNLVQKLGKESSGASGSFSLTADETATGPVVVSHFTHPGGPCFHFSQKPCDVVGAVPILSVKV